jgi:ACS family glucarate transporter-like MFS transporter
MRGIPRRAAIYALLFTFLLISMLDRINMSVAGSSIAKEMNLNPTELGYLFSSFLWIYILCLLPAGAMTDRLGTRWAVAGAVAFWSLAQMLSGFALGMVSLLFTRLGLGIFESPTNPCANRVIREWAPRSERGLASAIWISGSLAGPSLGALLVSWLVSDFGWRISFVATGIVGLVWVVIWLAIFRRPEEAGWLDEEERAKILAERDIAPAASGKASIGYRGLIASPTMWSLAVAQGCLTYITYFFLTWLPGYMQMSRGLSIMASGIYTALPYGLSIILCLGLSYAIDRMLSREALRTGKRRYAVAFGCLASASVLLMPYAETMWTIVPLLTIALTFSASSQSWNFALTNDLLRSPGDVGRAFAFVTLGGNSFGILAPIVTGYLVNATGNFSIAFMICGVLALLGAFIELFLVRGSVGESAPEPSLAPGKATA